MKPKRISEWLGEPSQVDRPPPKRRMFNDTTVDAGSAASNYQYLLGALRSRAPGMYSANVMELARHFTSGIFLAVNTQCNQAAAAEKKVMEKTHDTKIGDIELTYDEPACKLLDEPNTDDDWPDVMYSLTQQIGLTGMALLWAPREGELEAPSEMYVIPTATCLPWPPSPVYPHGSYLIQPFYPHGMFSTIPSYQSAAGARIPGEQIIRIKNQHPFLRYDGYAVLTAMSRQVDTIEGIDLARWAVQQSGVDPTIAIEWDPELVNPQTTDLARLRQQMEAVYAGPKNAGKIMFSPFGGKVTKLSTSPSEMAWTEGFDQLLSFILAAFGTPKSVAGMSDDTSYATLFASLKQYYILSLCPLLRKISGKITKHVLREFFGDLLYLTLTPERIDDRDLLEKQLSLDLQAGIRRKNEWRKLRDLPPIPGPEGEEWVTAGGKGGEGEQGNPLAAMIGKPNGKPREKPGGMDNEPEELREEEGRMDQDRPRNEAGRGALGPRKSMSANRLADVLDRAKVNGTAHAINGYDDGAAKYLKGR